MVVLVVLIDEVVVVVDTYLVGKEFSCTGYS